MGNHDTLRGCHKLLTYFIMMKIQVNIPLLLFRFIQHELDGRSSHPHGILVSRAISHHNVNLITFPSSRAYVPYSMKNLILMHFSDWDHPITPTTPLPALPTEEERMKKKAQKRVRMIIDSDEDFEFDFDDLDVGPSRAPTTPRVTTTSTPSVPTTAIFTEATSTSVPQSAGPSTSVPLSPGPSSSSPLPHSTPRARSSRSEVVSILPILGIEPTRKISVQTLLPLLQDTFLGFMNHMIQIQNQSNESLHRSLGLQPPPPFPTYQHPFHSAPTSPPRAQTSGKSAAPTPAPFVSPEDLVASLSRAFDATASEPSLAAVAELVSDMATSSGSQPVVEDAPIGRVSPVTTTAEPVRVDSSSEEETIDTVAADVPAPVVVSAAVPTTSVDPAPASPQPELSTAEPAPPLEEPSHPPVTASSPPATDPAPDSTQA